MMTWAHSSEAQCHTDVLYYVAGFTVCREKKQKREDIRKNVRDAILVRLPVTIVDILLLLKLETAVLLGE